MNDRKLSFRDLFEAAMEKRNAGHAGRHWLIAMDDALEAFDEAALAASGKSRRSREHRCECQPPYHRAGCIWSAPKEQVTPCLDSSLCECGRKHTASSEVKP